MNKMRSVNKKNEQWTDNDSEISDPGTFLTKGAFLLTPSYDLSIERAALICDKMTFKGCFSITKTASGILFKFSHPDDYLNVYRKGFHRLTGARFYKKFLLVLINMTKMGSANKNNERWNDNDSDISDAETFLAKGAFLLTPSYDLTMERAAVICDKVNFKGCFSLTKTATGILFKFSHPDDYLSILRKGFYRITGPRFYKKVAVPCRPQKTFTLYVLDVPEDLPVEDIRHALYKFNSVVEVVRLVLSNSPKRKEEVVNNEDGTSTPKEPKSGESLTNKEAAPPLIRVTLASLDEFNILLQSGLNFYDATFFPTDANLPVTAGKIVYKRRLLDGTIPGRVRELLPVFDAAGFCKIPPPASKIIKPLRQ